MAGCSTMKPSVHRKSAIGKRPGWAVHQSDFVRQTTGEGDQLILARYDVAIILGWHISVLPSGVVDSQFSSAEFLWLAWKKYTNVISRDATSSWALSLCQRKKSPSLLAVICASTRETGNVSWPSFGRMRGRHSFTLAASAAPCLPIFRSTRDRRCSKSVPPPFTPGETTSLT